MQIYVWHHRSIRWRQRWLTFKFALRQLMSHAFISEKQCVVVGVVRFPYLEVVLTGVLGWLGFGGKGIFKAGDDAIGRPHFFKLATYFCLDKHWMENKQDRYRYESVGLRKQFWRTVFQYHVCIKPAPLYN